MTPGEPLIRWDWLLSHAGEIGQRVGEHLELTLIAVAVGLLIAFLLSLAALRVPRLYGPISWTTGILSGFVPVRIWCTSSAMAWNTASGSAA